MASKFDFGGSWGESSLVEQFRPNVAALMVDEQGRVLVCERFRVPGAWQFPQGGVDEGEEHDKALLREVEEEVGFLPEHYSVAKSQGGYRYKFPSWVSKPAHKSHFVGQEQTYYLCRMNPGAPPVNLMQEPREFSQSRWIYPEEFSLAWLPSFKRETYQAVMKDFFGVKLSE